MSRALSIPLIFTALAALSGCGPSLAKIDPKSVVNVNVRPASGQLLYCPGDPFQVEVATKLKDGTTCSNVNADSGCLGQKDLVLLPELIHIQGGTNTSSYDASKFIMTTNRDVLATADTGVSLKAWLEDPETKHKSMEGESTLKPVYECMKEFGISDGQDVTVIITTLSTPFYPDAALVRLEYGTERTYWISPSGDKPLKVVAYGRNGMTGAQGQQGVEGTDGKDATDACGNGTDGTDGGPGQAGGRGGDGGAGGKIRVIVDDANADKLKARLIVASVSGQGGLGGRGGLGGPGGSGGKAGAGKPGDASCKPMPGQMGKQGPQGQNGPNGNPGPTSPAPTFENGKRASIFVGEWPIIQRIEAAKAK